MPTRGNPTDRPAGEPASTEFRVGRVTVGRWTLMRYPDDEAPDESRRRDDEVAEECHRSDADANGKLCAACGEAVDPTRRHPAAVAPADPSTVYLFCSAVCRTAWIDDGEHGRRDG
ncbi:hypothetical protein NDI76_00375 [Halogeometricum sp. S1BR25-6]|uniref:MYM-type domain-containing protein n=1 Tax=Halogeometricum salsisoli TaxID=2950536 RepID=A0ABU2G8S3_9EURY|nr:hypothetical protein [Halogeometricum sp. S1BR25-6]MDS0297195.1 hypothetical protein [Halogeometricum sp. S1BR25-6]